MRFLHTADWHLGRLFHGVHLTDDQHHVLSQLVEVVRQERPDAVLVAGDIYDRAVPPPDAVEVLDEVLTRLVIELQVPVVLIAGNHDSPGRLSFASRLLAQRRLYMAGSVQSPCRPLVLEDEAGPADIYALPYAEPSAVRQCLGDEAIADHHGAMLAMMQAIGASAPAGRRRILLGHAFVVGGKACESERPLSVGGAGTVGADCFGGFNYVALGHLHCPQRINGDSIRYAGSLLKYSFDETDQTKSIDLVEMDAAGGCTTRPIALTPRHDVRRIAGTMAELLGGTDSKPRDDYLEAMVMDEGPVLDAIGRLREVYPNVMSIQRPAYRVGAEAADRPNIRGLDERQLFAQFYEHVTAQPITSPQDQAFCHVADEMRRAAREAT